MGGKVGPGRLGQGGRQLEGRHGEKQGRGERSLSGETETEDTRKGVRDRLDVTGTEAKARRAVRDEEGVCAASDSERDAQPGPGPPRLPPRRRGWPAPPPSRATARTPADQPSRTDRRIASSLAEGSAGRAPPDPGWRHDGAMRLSP
jgi:hypothetical protein